MTTRDIQITERQLDIVRSLARGDSSEQTAKELGISVRTVKQHCDVLRAKLNVPRRRQIPEAYMRVFGVDPFPRPTK